MKEFSVLFFAQLAAYLLITMNYRAVAQGSYGWTGVTDLAFASMNFFLIRKVAKSETFLAWAGYTLGGVCGSLLGIVISKTLYGR